MYFKSNNETLVYGTTNAIIVAYCKLHQMRFQPNDKDLSEFLIYLLDIPVPIKL